MSSTTPLTDAINALTTYANEITGKSDTNLSDAVESLVDGYGGGGGGGITRVTGSVTGSGNYTQSINCDSAPDIVLIYRSDWGNKMAVSDRAVASCFCYSGYIGGATYTEANSTQIKIGGASNSSGTGTGIPVYNNITFSNGILRIRSNHNNNIFSSLLTYNYELFYLT